MPGGVFAVMPCVRSRARLRGTEVLRRGCPAGRRSSSCCSRSSTLGSRRSSRPMRSDSCERPLRRRSPRSTSPARVHGRSASSAPGGRPPHMSQPCGRPFPRSSACSSHCRDSARRRAFCEAHGCEDGRLRSRRRRVRHRRHRDHVRRAGAVRRLARRRCVRLRGRGERARGARARRRGARPRVFRLHRQPCPGSARGRRPDRAGRPRDPRLAGGARAAGCRRGRR